MSNSLQNAINQAVSQYIQLQGTTFSATLYQDIMSQVEKQLIAIVMHKTKGNKSKTAKILGLKIKWKGKGLNEVAINEKGKRIIIVNKKYFRPLEVDYLKGNASKAKKFLKWKIKNNLDDLIKEMIQFELNEISYL